MLKLVKMSREAKRTLLDLDVDYLYELQAECYTPLKNAQPSELGQMKRVHRLIRKAKPSLITISEAKVAAIRDPESNFSKFVNKLRAMGYEVEYTGIFTSDEEAEESLRITKASMNEFGSQLQKTACSERILEKF